jgi:hypothetical protein
MNDKVSIVVTSVSGPNKALRDLAAGCKEKGYHFIVIGDEASPDDFRLDGCDFYSLRRQRKLDLKFAENCPTKHYARKNIGYLIAIRNKTSVIIETDDDNIPCEGFWSERQRSCRAAVVENGGWVNVYRYFTDEDIWPRGFPLEQLQKKTADYKRLNKADVDCPIQEGLADDNPDVDAIYRLTLPLPQSFRKDRRIAMANGSWCPFNSQNTTWWPEAFELLYLPAYCSFRMTDIWRSFVAQKIAWLNGWAVLFHEPNMRQERNEHNLLRDFEDEIPGYLHNAEICEALGALQLKPGSENIGENLKVYYEKLVNMKLVGMEELDLLNAWLGDIKQSRK